MLLEQFHQWTRKMKDAPAAHRLEVDQLHTRFVADELAANVEHHRAFRRFNVIPAESQYFTSSKAQRERNHVRAFVTMSLHCLQEDLCLLGRKAPTFAVVELWTLRDRGHIARQDPVLLGHSQGTSQSRSRHSLGRW